MCPKNMRPFVVRATTEIKTMNTETTTGEYMLLFRGGHWDRGLSKEELQKAMDKVVAWFEGLNQRGKIKGAQPLSGQGRLISGTDGRLVVFFLLTIRQPPRATLFPYTTLLRR